MNRCTIVVPCYNEAARLDTAAFERFVADGHPCRFLFVNDGSSDQTAAVLDGLRRRNPAWCDVCHLPRNAGKAEAVRQGMLRALADPVDAVGFWDADLATPLEAIPEFCATLDGNPRLQMVIGARVRLLGRDIQRRAVRHYLGRIFATAASFVLRLPVYDTQCGAKLFRANPETRALFEHPLRTNWVFDVELLARFMAGRQADGRRAAEEAVCELPLAQWHDVAGSKVRPRDFLKSFFGLARIYLVYLRPGAASRVARTADDAPGDRCDERTPRRRAA